MSQSVVPSWNIRHQRQDQVDEGEGSRSFHVQNHPNPSYVVPMSADREVTELTWENGQISMHGISNFMPSPAPTKPTYPSPCGRPADHTLESIVHQATCHHKHNHMNMNIMQSQKAHEPSISNTAAAKAGQVQMLPPPSMVKKRMRSETESDQCGRYLSSSNRMHDLGPERSACASASATFCRDNNKDTTMMTWASFESPASFKTKTTDDDSTSHPGLENIDEEQETKGGTIRTCSARRSRAAATHNQSERRRRDRINQKMKALQKLVPNASKTDKASMLDEVIEYLKQLQAQVVHMMSTRTIMAPQMMMMNPLAMQQQQQLQMSLLARMGMSAAGVGVGMGLGMLDVNAMARTAAPAATPHSLQSLLINPSSPLPSTTPALILPPPFVVPPMTPAAASAANATNATTATSTPVTASNPFSNPYAAFLAQQTRENMDFYSKMATLYRQQQANQTRSNAILPNSNEGK